MYILMGHIFCPVPHFSFLAFFYSVMQPIGNRLYRNQNRQQEETANIEKELSRLEDDVRRLKIEFDIYFNGATKRPPLEARARLESNIKRISDNRSLSFAQRYQLNSLLAKFTSYRELWRRTLKARGEELI